MDSSLRGTFLCSAYNASSSGVSSVIAAPAHIPGQQRCHRLSYRITLAQPSRLRCSAANKAGTGSGVNEPALRSVADLDMR